MAANNDAIKTLVVDFYPAHLRNAIVRLEQDHIIDIKYWLIDEEGKYAGEQNMHTSALERLIEEYKNGERIDIAEHIYETGYQYLYSFINIDNRWKPNTETCTYVHDFNMLFRMWYHIIQCNQIELLLMGNAPHGPVPFMAYVVAKALDIKIIITEQEWFEKDRFMCFRSLDLIGCDYLDQDFGYDAITPEMMGGFQKTPFYMNYIPDEILDSGRFRIFPTLKRWLRPHVLQSKLKKYNDMLLYRIFEKLGYRVIEFYLDKRFRKHRNDQCQAFDQSKRFVYFPLHVQPEMTTDTLGGIYEDQLLAIERLAQLLPDNIYISVKENPAQTYYKRGEEFFTRLFSIPKVVLVTPETNTYDLIEHAEFVATITGTAGWEAITAGKKCLCFGYAWYRSLAGIIRYTANTTYEDILQYSFTKEEFDRSYDRFYRSLFPGIVAGDFFSILKDDFSPEMNNAEVYSSLQLAIEHYDG